MSELTPDKTRNQGFTLLEILLVVGVIAILAGIVIVAINPGRQLATVRNTQRKMNLGEINKALQQYYIDNRSYPDSVTTTLTEICNTGTGTTTHSVTCTDLVDLSPLVPTYLTAIPTDPQATSTGSGYMVMKDTANKIVLLASDAELGVNIGFGNAISTSGLISYWSFDGNALDSVGSSNGTLYGDTALTTGVKGIANTAYAFDGGGDYISLGSNGQLYVTNQLSVSFWMNIIDLDGNGWDTFIHKTTSNQFNDGWAVFMYNGQLSFMINAYNANLAHISSPSLNYWHHVVGVYNGSTLNIYVDGEAGTPDSYSGNVTNSNLPALIGLYRGSGDIHGSIDNVRIYNRALTADEIANIYAVEKP